MKYIWQYPSWPKLTWKSEALLSPLSHARRAQGQLIEKMNSLGFDVSPQAQAEILIEEAVQTSAIEGEKLDILSVRSSVMRKLGLPPQGSTKPNRSVDGLVDILLDAVTQYNAPLTVAKLKSWHRELFPTGESGFKKIVSGDWRSEADLMQIVSGPVGKEKIHYEAPPGGSRLKKEMNEFFSWWKGSRKDMDGVLRAGVAHFKFIIIHPFEDGNGRLARALTEMALAQDEKSKVRFYSLSSQIMKEREDYYRALQKTQIRETDITPWLEWFLGCFSRAIENSMGLMSQVLAKTEFWRMHAETGVTERQRKVLNRLLDAGKGNFQGGLTTRKYVALTKSSRATAFREIQDLLDKKLLVKNKAQGRSASYDIAW